MGHDIAREELTLATADGVTLEAEVALVTSPVGAVVLAHPHPLHGGSMRSLVTSELYRTLPEHGVATLRFNFRGVGESTGDHGGGREERHDIVAAIDSLTDRLEQAGTAVLPSPADPGVPLVLCGWSFGADVSLSITDDRLRAWFLIASPLRILPIDEMAAAHDRRPKVFAIPEHDEFRRPDGVRELTAGWTNVTIHTIAGADHYLAGRTARVATLLTELVDDLS